MEGIYDDFELFLVERISILNLEGQEEKDFIQAINTLLDNFGDALEHVIHTNEDVKGFLIKELSNGVKDLHIKELAHKNGNYPNDFDKLKFGLLRLFIEHDLLKKLVENYEVCLQEFAETEHELDVLLHQPALH